MSPATFSVSVKPPVHSSPLSEVIAMTTPASPNLTVGASTSPVVDPAAKPTADVKAYTHSYGQPSAGAGRLDPLAEDDPLLTHLGIMAAVCSAPAATIKMNAFVDAL